MATAFEVHPYGSDVLCRLVAEKAAGVPALVTGKRHLTFLEEYFATVGARTLVLENDYVDRDYLEDFAGYYVRCFHTYGRTCARIHFFTLEFSEADFEDLISCGKSAVSPTDLQDHYLGFMVVKPLPQSMIGRSCLKTYPDDEGRRHFPVIRSYSANLFGIELTVESLAFQEQDTVAAACATSALWSAFQGTASIFQHSIPSPVEITRAATRHSPPITRARPNQEGLSPLQMAEAIRSVGLEPLVVGPGDEFTLKANVYAYLKARVPLLLGATLLDPGLPPDEAERGLHALTVTGFSLGAAAPVSHPAGLQLRAFRIDKLYAHDDQAGPFARMLLLEDGKGALETSWLTADGTGLLRAVPFLLIVPLYHKIRIRLQAILDILFQFDDRVETFRRPGLVQLPQRLEWDVYLYLVHKPG